VLSAAHREMINARCDAVVASRSADLAPSICWAMGSHVHEDGRGVTVWVLRAQAGSMLADLAANGQVSVVFAVPFTAASLQVKGHDARVRDASAADAAILRRYVDNMVREIELVHFPEVLTRTVFEQELDALAALEFTVSQVFEQTPGPGAGLPIGAAR
jgi:hypothetical protein